MSENSSFLDWAMQQGANKSNPNYTPAPNQTSLNGSPTVGQSPLGYAPTAYNLYNTGNNLYKAGNSLLGSSSTSAAESAAASEASNAGMSLANPSIVGQTATGEAIMSSGSQVATPFLGETATSLMPIAAPLAVGAIGAYTASKGLDAYNKAKHKGVLGGLQQGIKSAGPLNFVPLLGQVPWMAGALSGAFGGKKHKDQYARDFTRDTLEDRNLTTNNIMNLEKTGYKLDLGKDGGFRYTNDQGVERPVYNIDFESDPDASQAVGWLNPIADLITEGDQKRTSDLVSQIYNEIKKNGAKDIKQVREAVLDIYHNLQLKPSVMKEALGAMKIDQGKKDAYFAAIDSLRPGAALQKAPETTKKGQTDIASDVKKDNLKPIGMPKEKK